MMSGYGPWNFERRVFETLGTSKYQILVFFISGLKKKLFALSKEKDCDIIQLWMKSIINHLYWTAASSSDQDGELNLAKWKALCNHIINVHNGHNSLFAICEHGELEGRERKKNGWIQVWLFNEFSFLAHLA